MGYFHGAFVVFEADYLRVFEGVCDASVAEDLHYVEYVSGFVVFNCGFPVAERVKADLQ